MTAATCPFERYPDLPTAQAALVQRRARATLARNPHTYDRTAVACEDCGGAHIRRVGRVQRRAAA